MSSTNGFQTWIMTVPLVDDRDAIELILENLEVDLLGMLLGPHDAMTVGSVSNLALPLLSRVAFSDAKTLDKMP
jgi:hypothetical protein